VQIECPPCAGALASQQDAAWQIGCFSGLMALPGTTKSGKSQLQRACSVGFWQLALSKCKLSVLPCTGALTSQKDAVWQQGCYSVLLAQQKVKKPVAESLLCGLLAAGTFKVQVECAPLCWSSNKPERCCLAARVLQGGCLACLAQQKVKKVSLQRACSV